MHPSANRIGNRFSCREARQFSACLKGGLPGSANIAAGDRDQFDAGAVVENLVGHHAADESGPTSPAWIGVPNLARASRVWSKSIIVRLGCWLRSRLESMLMQLRGGDPAIAIRPVREFTEQGLWRGFSR